MLERDHARRHRRSRVRVPLYITLAADTNRELVPVESRDFSVGGVGFETGRKLPLEADSRLVLSQMGDLPESAAIMGTVVHRGKNPVTDRYKVGVEFTQLVHITEEKLIATIRDWETRSSPRARAGS
jgi:c-di-GMP-binding flagellar brake protein YcgR